jgi:hypothetical protein
MLHTSPNFVLLFGLAALCALLANTLMFVAIGQVNRKLPDGGKISYLRWSMGYVKQQYSKYYPQGKLIFLVYGCGILMLILLSASFFFRK